GIKPERAEVLAGGVAALSAVFETFRIEEMKPAKGALRAGLLYDLLGRRESHDIRVATVERWQRRFGVDDAQSERVAATALRLFQSVQPAADDESAKCLEWAARLHEIGFAISHSDYHKHSAYLVLHGDLAGFSTSDQERMADLVLGQRGNLRKVAPVLEQPERAAQLLALRLAVVIHHARRVVELPKWSLRFNRSIELGFERGWIEQHPLTRHLLDEEGAQWERVGVRFVVKEI
ncbi:MAG TPA: Ppx/GppA family phosphatase, partial [Burkholderiaceae bacterium]